jgi:hypothetical protein
MQTSTLLRAIKQLPVASRFQIVEQTLRSIKRENTKRQIALAADRLYDDYMNDKELTAFTALDFEDFYETK